LTYKKFVKTNQKTIISSLNLLEKLRMSILKNMFEGKLVSQDPKDEPASVLLERIKKEKTESVQEKMRIMD